MHWRRLNSKILPKREEKKKASLTPSSPLLSPSPRLHREGVPDSHNDAMVLESEALSQVALRCAVRSMSRPGSRMASRAASRAVSRAVSRRPSINDLTDPEEVEAAIPGSTTAVMSDDAFEQILDVTTHQEALMAYYYLDDNNEVLEI